MPHPTRRFPDFRRPAEPGPVCRREFLRRTSAAAMLAAMNRLAPAWAQPPHAGHAEEPAAVPERPTPLAGQPNVVDLVIERVDLRLGNRTAHVVAANGSLPGPLLRFREGEQVELRVTNRLRERTAIHWHGVLVPAEMDGVPGVSFKGIEPDETFVYRFALKQYGTYWYHAHIAMQEQLGLYGPIVIDPAGGEPFNYAREHVVVLSDWTFSNPHALLAKLKKRSNFSNLQRRTALDLWRDVRKNGLAEAWSDWGMWARMRMDPTDIADLTGEHLTYLLNGRPAESAWSGLFTPGERVRLRFINAAATTHFDVRIPGLPMTVVQADGQHVHPVRVEEFRMGAAETYDVIVEPADEKAYAIFAETTDRSGYAFGTLAPRERMLAPIPAQRQRPIRTMADMGMGGHEPAAANSGSHATMSGEHSSHGGHVVAPITPASDLVEHVDAGGGRKRPARTNAHAEHGNASGAGTRAMNHAEMDMPDNVFGPGNAMMAISPSSRAHEPGLGLGGDGWRVLVYRDLVAHEERDMPEPQREIVMHLTGNMERFIWGFDGKKFSEAEPVRLRFGERVRITFINETMMEHPLHLHGMFMELENGARGLPPRKHTVIVKPAEKLSVLVTADARGHWAFHCHLQYHMEAGMFRVFEVA